MMRIGLVADTHIPEARKELWPQVFDAFRDVDMIFHGGDIHELYVLDQLNELAPLYSARGNGEDGSAGRPIQPEDPRLRYAWQLDLEGLNIGLTHYIPVPERPPNLTVQKWLERYFPDQKPDVIVYGDTHVEYVGVIDGILCVNPGSPTYPHNYNTQLGTIGFLELDNGKADASVWQLTEDGIEPFDWDKWPRPRD
ncbi:MAG: metallophosphoesterase family protein [Pseudomonadota bacterium]